MRTRSWMTNHIVRSRLLPEAFFGAAYPQFNINNPEQTFTGFTYAIEVEETHNGWDHFVGILYSNKYWESDGGDSEILETLSTARIKKGVKQNTYQFMLNLATLFDIGSSQAILFDNPIGAQIYFYVQPMLIDPSSHRISYLWDRTKGPFGLKGFPVGIPGAIDRDLLPFIEV